MTENYIKSFPKAYQLLMDFYESTPSAKNNPRSFYDFFDSHKIFVQVRMSRMGTAPDSFYWCYNIKKINKETQEIEDAMFHGRAYSDLFGSVNRCENFAWREAMAILEENIDVKKLRKAKMKRLNNG